MDLSTGCNTHYDTDQHRTKIMTLANELVFSVHYLEGYMYKQI